MTTNLIKIESTDDHKPMYLHSRQRVMSESEAEIDDDGNMNLPLGANYHIGGTPVTENVKFEELTDVTGAYTTPNAIYRVNDSGDGLEETTIIVDEPSANQFNISSGTTDLLVTADSTIDQDLSTTSDVTHNSLYTGYIDFDLLFAGTTQEGRLAWDPDAGTLQVGMPGGDVNLQIGQEIHLPNRPKNGESIQINNGQVVYISGAAGAVPEVKLANASDFSNACKTLAIATENVASSQRGFYTTYGIVRDVNTGSYSEGTALWLDTVDGGFTDTRPEAPNCSVKLGYVIRQHATEGAIFVAIDVEKNLSDNDVTREPTGFTNPENVIVTYDSSARTITLTGTVNGYYKGQPVAALTSGWVSDAHLDVAGTYVLAYTGSSFEWLPITSLRFYYLLIAFVSYGASDKFSLRECHGLLQWQAHKISHETIGTYKYSGGTLSDYVLSSTTVADRRPSVSATYLYDEDLLTINPALAANGPYNQFTLSSTDTPNFNPSALDIVPLSTNQPYWNEFTGGAWQQTLMSNNYYMSIWLVAIPCSADATSQSYRYIWVQGQSESLTILEQRSLNPNDVSLGAFTSAIPELVFISQVIIRYQAANWVLSDVILLEGTRFSQTSSPQGTYLSVVTTDTTITGNGTVSDPLSIGQAVTTSSSPTFLGLTVSGLSDGFVKSTSGILSGGNSVNLTTDVSETLPIGNGGTNSATALNNDRVIISNSGAIVESSITTTNLGVLANITSISTGTSDNDKIITKGYGDDTYISSITSGNLTEDTSSILTIGNGTNAVLGSGTTIQVKQASSVQSGYLSSTDWDTFNGKQDALSLPLSISNGGTNSGTALNNDRVIISNSGAIVESAITTTNLGVLSGITAISTGTSDNDTIITKGYGDDNYGTSITTGDLTEDTSSILTIGNGTDAVVGSGTTIQVKQAGAAQSGYLSSTDWNTFNNKQDGLSLPLGLSLGGTGLDTSGVTDGQLLIGGTASNDFQLATITGGAGITVTNGTNTITISSAAAAGTYAALTDVSAPYSNAYALTRVNSTPDGMEETTTLLTEPSANQFQISRGTTDLLVTADCTIDQNLSTTSDVTHDDITSTGYYYVDTDLLTVGSSPVEIIIGSDHAKYSTIANAFAGETGIRLYRLLPETFSENIALNTESSGSRLIGELSTLNGQTNLNSRSSVKLYSTMTSGTYGITNAGSSPAYFDCYYVDAGSVTTGVLGTNIISNIEELNLNSKVFVGGSSSTAQSIISNNAYSGVLATTGDSGYIATSATGSLLSSISNRSVATAGGNTNYFINLSGDSAVYSKINDTHDYDYIINQSNGSIFLRGNYLDGDITISGGQSYINANYIKGDITSTAGVDITTYFNVPYHDGSVSRSTPSELIGFLGKAGDSGIDCYTGTGWFTLKGRGLTTDGGGMAIESYITTPLSTIYFDRSTRDMDLHVDADSASYQFRVYNSYSGRSMTIYNDALAASNGTVYANSGVLTRTNPSDKRLKDDIFYFEKGSYLDKIRGITPAKFKWKINGHEDQNFIAQDMLSVFPENVATEMMPVAVSEINQDDGTPTKYDYEERYGLKDNALLYLWVAVQELADKVDEIESKLV